MDELTTEMMIEQSAIQKLLNRACQRLSQNVNTVLTADGSKTSSENALEWLTTNYADIEAIVYAASTLADMVGNLMVTGAEMAARREGQSK